MYKLETVRRMVSVEVGVLGLGLDRGTRGCGCTRIQWILIITRVGGITNSWLR